MCRQEASTVAEASVNRADSYIIVGMPASEGEQNITDFIEGRNVGGFDHVLDTSALWQTYGVQGIPAWLSISAEGEINSGHGAIPAEVISGEIWS